MGRLSGNKNLRKLQLKNRRTVWGVSVLLVLAMVIIQTALVGINNFTKGGSLQINDHSRSRRSGDVASVGWGLELSFLPCERPTACCNIDPCLRNISPSKNHRSVKNLSMTQIRITFKICKDIKSLISLVC